MINNPKKICVLGGGFGGLYTALELSKSPLVKSGEWQITLVEQKDHFLFTPLLYELVTGELQTWQIAPSYQKLLRQTKIKFCQEQVENISLQNRQVRLEDQKKLDYDYLVLALGTKSRLPNFTEAVDNLLTFRTLADVALLNEKLHILEASQGQRLQIAVIGSGANGVELACKVADRIGKRGQVYLIERSREILKYFSAGVRKAAHRAIKERKIKLYLETSIEAVDHKIISLSYADNLTKIPADLILWTAGTQSLEWIPQLAESNAQGKLLTHSTLQLINYPEVFVLGDMGKIINSNEPVPDTAQAAYQQAPVAANNIKAIIQRKKLKHFHYLHLGDMLTLGKGAAIVSSFFLNIEGGLAENIRRLVYIQRLPTRRHRWQVLKNLFLNSLLKKLGIKGRQVREDSVFSSNL